MYYNEFKTNGNKIETKDRIAPQPETQKGFVPQQNRDVFHRAPKNQKSKQAS